METEMEKECKAIIEKHMPEQVGDVLKKRLKQAEEDAIKLKQQNELLVNNNLTITNLEKVISNYKNFDERNSNLEVREKAVAESERNLQIKKLEYELASEKEKTQFSKDVAMGLVRNTEYRKQKVDGWFCTSSLYLSTSWYYLPTELQSSRSRLLRREGICKALFN